jgi:hypothetical protein
MGNSHVHLVMSEEGKCDLEGCRLLTNIYYVSIAGLLNKSQLKLVCLGTCFKIRIWIELLKKVNFINSSQNERLSPSGLALSFDKFDSISWQSLSFSSNSSFTVFVFFFQISNFFDPSITEETWIVEIRIWCIKIGIVLVLWFNHAHKCM